MRQPGPLPLTNSPLKVTIIVATYNAEARLADLLDSIVPQKAAGVELIVVDGGSTDRTTEIIAAYGDWIDDWVSEPDAGIYDAWNKGIRRSTGDWVMFLGADDLLQPHALATYGRYLAAQDEALDYVSAKAQMVNPDGSPAWVNGRPWRWPRFKYEMMVAHPGSLHSRQLFTDFGPFDPAYRIVGDYELLLRRGMDLRTGFVDAVTVRMTEGGVSYSFPAFVEYFRVTTRVGKANRARAFLRGAYMLGKSKFNLLGRRFGLSFNRNRG